MVLIYYQKKKIFSSLKISQSVLIITNIKVYKLHYKKLKSTLLKLGLKISKIILPDGEQYKTISTVKIIFETMIKKNFSRKNTLIALGGGVIGDLTGFVSSCYKRGIQFIQIPTTLLAQIDSSIGGKNSINYSFQKNLIGTFYQPISVIIDLNTLKTLPKKQFYCGLAEIIKYGISFDYNFFCWLEKNIKKLINLEKKTINYCVKYCCSLKAKIIHKDEKEIYNNRILLNLGHTFGHAIESEFKYKNWSHGEAISIGIIMAAKTAELFGKLNKKKIKRIIRLFKKAHLPTRAPEEIKPKKYLTHMIKDKKSFNNQINLILPCTIGKVELFNNINYNIILKAIKNCF